VALGPVAGNDSRISGGSVQQVLASGISDSLNQVISVTSDTLFGASYAYITSAIQRGWLSNAPTPDYPFSAWQYMVGVWISFMNGTVPQGSKMPYWMWALGRAISPKGVPKGLGQIYYKALASTGSFPSLPIIPLGPLAYGYEGNLYVPALTETDLFPNAQAPATPVNQEAAFLSLCGFMAHPGMKSTEMRDSNVVTSLDKDVSAFCTILDVTGFGQDTNGGAGWLATLEVPIHTPLLAPALVQSTNGTTGSPTRYANRATEFGGDALFMANSLSSLVPEKFWKTKIAPKFKFIDFLQFGEVLALWLGKITSQYFLDPAMAVAASFADAQAIATAQCPITLQEMLIIFRNEIMFAFAATQNGVQSILPTQPTGAGDNQFMPFLTGTTGAAIQSFGMKLPLKLVENLRSLLLHVIPGKSRGDVEMLFPVIGKYNSDVLTSTDYTFTSLDNEGFPLANPIFPTIPPVVRRRRDSKSGGDIWEKTALETVINLIDTSNGTTYVFINDPNRLQTLVTLWNEHVTKYAAYSDPLTPFSADPGVNVLNSTNQTRYWANPSSSSELRTRDVKDERVLAKRNLVSSVYATRQAYAISYREMPYQVTETITSQWILPVSYLQTGSASASAAAFTRTAAMNQEPFSSTFSATGDVGQTFAALNDAYASSMAHAKGTESQLTSELQNLAKQGHAGILSSIVAGFLGNTFGSTVGTIATGVANMLPI